MEQIEGNFNELSEAEANEISEFLIETFSFLMGNENNNQNPQEPTEEAPLSSVESPMPVGSDLLWILAGGQPNAFVNYLRTYPGEGFQELVNDPNRLAQVIAQLEQQDPPQEPQIKSDGIPDTQFPSSNVAGMKYDPKSGKLLVKFHGDNVEPVYQYEGVPPQIFNLLEHGNAFAKTAGKNRWGEWWKFKKPSIGASVNEYLKKGGYSYSRLR